MNIVQEAWSTIFGGTNVSVADVHLTIPNRFDFGPHQGNSSLEGFYNFIIPTSVPIGTDGSGLWTDLFLGTFFYLIYGKFSFSYQNLKARLSTV